ncbi:Uncharacterised protein [Legionella wadsworthii]|uniref:Uncharacterized protein n=1 Tax=Legionella wadsworthii TaxID=28088 RepID=A0A378LT72_9GAMM|nr:hypothetical protein [Legionella wadsworthii]STY29907.1 Uncharacterised protein [Legionella wadsworthii]
MSFSNRERSRKGKFSDAYASDQKSRVNAALEKGKARKEAQLKKEEIEQRKKEAMSDILGQHGIWKQLKAAQVQVQAEEDPQITEGVKEAKRALKRIKNVPPAIESVVELVESLNSFKGEIGLGTDLIRQKMAVELSMSLVEFQKNYKKEDALAKFLTSCQLVMKNNYKKLASEPTIWNFIKDKLNNALKWVGLAAKGFLIDTTLDSSAVIKDENVQENFKNVLRAKIKIDDAPDVDTSLKI